MKKLRAEPSLIGNAVEELLRYDSPVQRTARITTTEVELAGQPLAKGTMVITALGAANRDPAQFADPDRFDITRDPNPHLSFGVGPHFCLGAALAKLEAKVLLTELFTRLPDLRVAGPPERLRSNFINGIRHLPVRFTPRKISG